MLINVCCINTSGTASSYWTSKVIIWYAPKISLYFHTWYYRLMLANQIWQRGNLYPCMHGATDDDLSFENSCINRYTVGFNRLKGTERFMLLDEICMTVFVNSQTSPWVIKQDMQICKYVAMLLRELVQYIFDVLWQHFKSSCFAIKNSTEIQLIHKFLNVHYTIFS